MVRVCAGLAHHVHGILNRKAFLPCQDTDQLGNYHRGMGVIDLDRCILIHVVQVAASLLQLADNELRTVADHEIFLINTKQVACLIGIIRIKEQCQVLVNRCLVKVDSFLHKTLVHRLNIEKVQLIAAVLISDYINVVEHGGHLSVTECHLKAHTGIGQP